MMAFIRHRVGAKIILGYLIALLLMMGVGYFTVSRLSHINSTVDNLTGGLAVERSLAQDVVSQVWLVRFHGNKYVRTQNQTDLDRYNSEFARLQGLLDEANTLTSNPERREKLALIETAVQDYGTAFRRVTELINLRQEVQSEILDVQALVIENKVSSLRVSSDILNDSRWSLALGNAQTGFQQMRLNVVYYLSTNDPSYIILYERGYQSSLRGFVALQSSADEKTQSSGADAQAAIEAYNAGFEDIQTYNTELSLLFRDQLDVLEPQISNTASDIAANVAQEFTAQNESSKNLVAETRLIVAITTLIGIVVVLGLGITISRRITAPLRRVMLTSQQIAKVDLHVLTAQLAALAKGDLRFNLDLTAQPLDISSEDEVGQMAAAFNEIIAGLHRAGGAFGDMSHYLNQMAVTATSVAEGDLEVHVEAQSTEDVLGNALVGMVTNLRATTAELGRYQEHLEKIVEERTAQLERKKQEYEIVEAQFIASTWQLDREKKFLEALVTNSPIAIVVMDLENQIQSWNLSAEKLFGYTLDEAVGRDIDQIIGEVVEQSEAVSLSPQNHSVAHASTQRWQRNAQELDVEVMRVPVIVEDEQVGSLAIYHDITELQRARREAETANYAKSAFLATMSHEIRTPMNGVIGMTSLLLDTFLSDEQRDYTETIRNSADALLTIVNDILDFSKIEAGKMELETQPFDLHSCVESALDLLVVRAREKQLELVYIIDPQVPGSLVGDVTRLRQILLNLLSNSIKFTETGEVVLSVTGERLADTHTYDLHFSVRDTGIGVPLDRLGILFQSFTQADASTTRKYGGTGLGLAISKRLSELMGGTMWVESEVGKGSTFYFTIQAKAAPAQPRVYLTAEQPQLRDKHVLIVDDNATNRRVLVAQTRAWNMLPRETESPQEALDWIRRGDPFDLVLLDMQMPDMDGVTLALAMREHRDLVALPIVMLSSLDRQESGADAAQLAAHLTKPIKQSILYETIMSVFVGQRAVIKTRTVADEPLFDRHLADRLPLRILVAEDNAINQKLALQMLRKMGYHADVAGNGLEVLEAIERQSYDVVLMDVQMPEMDGFETTRHLYQAYGETRPRIIAMTANAMQGDREACLAAGMDDYISKPIQVRDLQLALERWGQSPTSVPASLSLAAKVTKTEDVIDWTVLDKLRALQDDEDPHFLQDMIDAYLSETPTIIESIRQALSQGRAKDLRHWAHTLKANSNALGALRVGEVCLALEKIGRDGSVEGAQALLASLKGEFDQAQEVFRKTSDMK